MNQKLVQLLTTTVKRVYDAECAPVLLRPEPQFGDFATNAAMQLAGVLKKPPREIAEKLALELRQETDIASVEVAGPGFINITLTDEALLSSVEYSQDHPLDGSTWLVEYSDPNPFKPLHAGHLYTTLVGDVIARLVARAGANVIRLNFGGDVGLHAARSMWAIIRHFGGEFPEKLHRIPEETQAAWMGERYVDGTNAYEEDPQAKQEIIEVNKRIYDLHDQLDRTSAFANIYWTCREWSYRYFEQLYNELQVVPFDRFIPESEVTPLGIATVKEQLARGVFAESEGAVVFEGEKHGLHTRVFINSQGLPTYETKDVGLSLTKWRDYQFDQSVIITANEQMQYMQVVLKAIEQFAPEPAQRTKHLTHGLVKLQGGVKMSSRKGNIVSALDIIESARQAAAQGGMQASEETVLAAIKYALLKQRLGGDMVYDPKESIALEGNSGPYIQYAHARACSVMAKAESEAARPASLEPGERLLARTMSMWGEAVVQATAELMPHHICTYLYELTQVFNRFYETNRVIGDARQSERLWLLKRYESILKDGLELLGIHAPEKM